MSYITLNCHSPSSKIIVDFFLHAFLACEVKLNFNDTYYILINLNLITISSYLRIEISLSQHGHFLINLSLSLLSYSFYSLRFLLGFCDPKFGSADSVDWLKEFEIKRKKIQKSANLRARDIDLWSDKKNKTGQGVIETLLVTVFFGEVQTKYIETILSGLALSFSIDEVETNPSAARDGLSRVRLLVSAISGVGSSLRCYKGYDVSLNNMLQGLKADNVSKNIPPYDDTGKGKGMGIGGVGGMGGGMGQRSAEGMNSDVINDEEGGESGYSAMERQTTRDGDRERNRDNDRIIRFDQDSMGNPISAPFGAIEEKLDSWLGKSDLPLLARPLLDTAVLLLALTHPSVLCEEEETVQESFDEIVAATTVSGYSAQGQVVLRGSIICEIQGSSKGNEKEEGKGRQVDTHYHQEVTGAAASAIRWLCIAALAQLMVAECMQADVSIEDTPSTSSTATASHDAILESWLVNVLYKELADVVACNVPSIHGHMSSSTLLTKDPKRVTSVVEKWHAFLCVIARMLFLCRPDLAAELACYPPVKLTSQVRICFFYDDVIYSVRCLRFLVNDMTYHNLD